MSICVGVLNEMPLPASHCPYLTARCTMVSTLQTRRLRPMCINSAMISQLINWWNKNCDPTKPLRPSTHFSGILRGSDSTGEWMAWFIQHSGHCHGFLTSSCLTKSADSSVYDMPLNLGLTLKPSLLNNPWYLLYKGRAGPQLWEGCTCNAADFACRTCLIALGTGHVSTFTFYIYHSVFVACNTFLFIPGSLERPLDI